MDVTMVVFPVSYTYSHVVWERQWRLITILSWKQPLRKEPTPLYNRYDTVSCGRAGTVLL